MRDASSLFDVRIRVQDRDYSAIYGETENPKSEARNPRQYPMTQIQRFQKKAKLGWFCFGHWKIQNSILFRVSACPGAT
jgi:hypothetical protein